MTGLVPKRSALRDVANGQLKPLVNLFFDL